MAAEWSKPRLDVDGRIDLDALEDAFTRASASGAGKLPTCCVIRTTRPQRCTPSTNCGGVAERARRFGVRVVSDEIHAPVILPGRGSPRI